jgi:hypothetical protein
MRIVFRVLVLSVLVACRGPRIQGNGSGARIRQSGPTADLVQRLVDQYEGEVIAILGTRYDREYVIELDPEEAEVDGQVDKISRRMQLGKDSLANEQALKRGVIHELVHIHATDLWEEGPDVLEEGFAYLIAALLMDEIHEYSGPPPTMNEYLEILTIDYDEYRGSSRERRAEINWNAACLAHLMLRNSSAVKFSEAKWRAGLERARLDQQWHDGKMILVPRAGRPQSQSSLHPGGR